MNQPPTPPLAEMYGSLTTEELNGLLRQVLQRASQTGNGRVEDYFQQKAKQLRAVIASRLA